MDAREKEKKVEFGCVQAVAKAGDWDAHPEGGDWPDGWLVDRQCRVSTPAEVVYAFEPLRGEGPGTSSGSRRAWSRANRVARERAEALGVPVSFTANGDEPWVEGVHGIAPPPVTQPVHFDKWILAAIERKLAKKYAQRCVLIVCVRWPDLTGVSMHLDLVRPFRAQWSGAFVDVWVTNHYGDPAHRL